MSAAPLLALSLALLPPLAQADAELGGPDIGDENLQFNEEDFGFRNDEIGRVETNVDPVELTPQQRAEMEAAAGGIFAVAGGLICVGLLISLVALAAFIWVVVDVSKRPEMDTGMKVVWALVAWFVPILGPVIYYFVGRKPATPASRV